MVDRRQFMRGAALGALAFTVGLLKPHTRCSVAKCKLAIDTFVVKSEDDTLVVNCRMTP